MLCKRWININLKLYDFLVEYRKVTCERVGLLEHMEKFLNISSLKYSIISKSIPTRVPVKDHFGGAHVFHHDIYIFINSGRNILHYILTI